MSISNGTKLFVFILLGIGLGLAALFVYVRVQDASVDDFYVVVDSFQTTQLDSIAVVTSVQLEAQDSLKMLRVCEKIVSKKTLKVVISIIQKKRTLVYKCFVRGTTKSLSTEQLEELSYTNPMVQNAADSLLFVPKGSIVRVRFAAGYIQPKDRTVSSEEFFIPKK